MKRRDFVRSSISVLLAMLLPGHSRRAEATTDAEWRHIYIANSGGSVRVFVDRYEVPIGKYLIARGNDRGLWIKIPKRKGGSDE